MKARSMELVAEGTYEGMDSVYMSVIQTDGSFKNVDKLYETNNINGWLKEECNA